MKRILKISGISIGLLLILLIAAPFVFKGKIIQGIKKIANEQLSAKLDFDEKSLSVSFIRSFPRVSVGIDNISIIGKDSFIGDTLCELPELRVSLDLMSVIKGEKMQIKHVYLKNPNIDLETLPSGKANWDIMKPSSDTTKNSVADFKLALQSFEVEKGNLTYNDRAMGFTTRLKDFDHESSGDFTQSNFVLKTKTTTPSLDLSYGGIEWLHHIQTAADADIEMDIPNMKFGFGGNNVKLNELDVQGKGFVDLNENDIDCNIQFKALQNTFKHFLSIIPGMYSKDFAQVKASGLLDLSGSLVGKITEDKLPKTDIHLNIKDGTFQFPNLEYPANGIQCALEFINTDGQPDNTMVDLKKLDFNLAGDPFSMKLLLKTPVSNPYMEAVMNGIVDLDKWKKMIPLEAGTVLSGKINSDLQAKGYYSSATSKNFEKLDAKGVFETHGFSYKTKENNFNTEIQDLKLALTPQTVNVDACKGNIGKNDFDLNGNVQNLLGYLFNNETLRGAIKFNSNYLNVNNLMGESNSASDVKATDTAQLGIVELPGNLNMQLQANIGKLIYDNLIMQELNGNLKLHDGQLDFEKVGANILGGRITLDGNYDSKNIKQPFTKLITNVQSLSITDAFNYFGTVQKYAPVAKFMSGLFNANIDMSSILNDKMQPNYNSMNVKGELQVTDAAVKGLEIVKQLGALLKVNWLENLQLKNQKIKFLIKDGVFSLLDSLTIPLPKGAVMKLGGTSKLNQEIAYTGWIKVPREAFGAVNTTLDNLTAQAAKKNWDLKVEKMIPIDLKIGGTILKPQIQLGLKGFKESIVNNLKDQAKDIAKSEVNKELAVQIAKAKAEAEKIKAEARKRADQVRAEGKATADKMRTEVKANADKLRQEGALAKQKVLEDANTQIAALKAKATDPLAKLAADKAADKLKKEAEKKAAQVQAEYDAKIGAAEKEGNAKADKVEAEANKTADKIEQEAAERADKLVKEAEEKAKV